jgi:hypothetical protein
MAPYLALFPSDKELWEKMSPEERKESTCQKVDTPNTVPVPSVGQDVTYSDWLFQITDECDIGIDIACPPIFTICAPAAVSCFVFGAPFILGALIAALGLFTGYIWCLEKGQNVRLAGPISGLVADIRIWRLSKRNLRRAVRKANRLDAKTGWRPREGIPHPKGRNDTYDRWLVEGHSTSEGLMMGLRHWVCSPEGFWMPQKGLESVSWFEDEPETEIEIGNCRGQLEEKIKILEKRAINAASNQQAISERAFEDAQASNSHLLKKINDESAATV